MAIKAANDKSMSNITALPSGVNAKSMILLATETASSSSTINFTSGIDSTYKEYIFKCYDIHPSGDATDLQINFRDGSTAYDATKTTTVFRAYHNEAGDDTTLSYQTSWDLAQGTGVQLISHGIDNDNDSCAVATLHLFDPSSTTFVKHFLTVVSNSHNSDYEKNTYTGGYYNTTSDIDAVQFTMSSGNIDAGTIKLYGIKDS